MPDEPDHSPRPHRWFLAWLATLFFLSGMTALIYQVLWLRLLGIILGVTVYAASTVWAVFMAGLAVGSLIGGRAADRVRRPLVWFGVAEALIGLTAVATPALLDALHGAYGSIHDAFGGSLAGLTVMRVLVAFLVLLVPSVLMGTTLPLVVRSSVLRAEHVGGRSGVLYATNTAGAIAGSLLAGLVLIPRLGIARAFAVAAGINGLVAVLAIAGGRRPVTATEAEASPAATGTGSPAGAVPRRVALVVLGVFALSGFVSLGLEVVWFRVLTLFLRPTVYGYSLMLAAVLGGIALGSYAVAPWLRRRPDRDWTLVLAGLEGAIAVAGLASFMALRDVPRIAALTASTVARVTGDFLAYQIVVSVAVILPTMLLFGAAFPIGLHVWATARAGHDRSAAGGVGVFYALNVAGAILGSLAVGFVLLPLYGSLVATFILTALSAAGALALLAVAPVPIVRRGVAAAVLVAVVVLAARATPDPMRSFLEQRYPGQDIIWWREAVQATVSVHEERLSHRSLNVSGNHQASTQAGMVDVHHRIGHLPMAVHPEARDALVIGLGGGATAGAISQHTGVEVDVVELSREVAEAADRYFGVINYDVLKQPNVRLHVDDGRNFLALTNRRYDVITADVILPIHAGSGNLYSAEYFTLARRALKPGGVVLQWVAGTEAEYKLIVRTFLSVFPETTLWFDGSLLVGSVEPLRLRESDFNWKQAVPQRRAMLETLGVRTFDDLLKLYRAGPAELRRYVGDGPILTDDRPMVEYFLSLPRDRGVNLRGVDGDVRRHVDRNETVHSTRQSAAARE
jgi:spermidine synthase